MKKKKFPVGVLVVVVVLFGVVGFLNMKDAQANSMNFDSHGHDHAGEAQQPSELPTKDQIAADMKSRIGSQSAPGSSAPPEASAPNPMGTQIKPQASAAAPAPTTATKQEKIHSSSIGGQWYTEDAALNK